MKPHVVTITKRGREALDMYSLTKLHNAILTAASERPSPPVHMLMRKVRSTREVAFTQEYLAKELADLSKRGYVTIHQ